MDSVARCDVVSRGSQFFFCLVGLVAIDFISIRAGPCNVNSSKEIWARLVHDRSSVDLRSSFPTISSSTLLDDSEYPLCFKMLIETQTKIACTSFATKWDCCYS